MYYIEQAICCKGRVGGVILNDFVRVYDFLPHDILPHDTLSLHPDCDPNPNPNTYPNPSPNTYPNPNHNPNLDVEAKCHEIWGRGVKRCEVKSPFPGTAGRCSESRMCPSSKTVGRNEMKTGKFELTLPFTRWWRASGHVITTSVVAGICFRCF